MTRGWAFDREEETVLKVMIDLPPTHSPSKVLLMPPAPVFIAQMTG